MTILDSLGFFDNVQIFVDSLELPKIIPWAGPVMIALVLVEWYFSNRTKLNNYDGKEMLAATIIGVVNVAITFGIKLATFGVFYFFYTLTPLRIPTHWWTYIICIISIDFCRYWAHRIAHEQRFWWATHVTHHSSENYNWAVSFRLSWTQHIKIVFFIPPMLLGFDPIVFFICHQIEVLYQFWIHTEFIKKLPRPIEYIFTTPSHHRVHHARNPKYIDRNYGSTLIIWDRMFGTFMAEEERPDYGITKPVLKKYNPVYLVFHEWYDIARDMRAEKSWKRKFKILFGRP